MDRFWVPRNGIYFLLLSICTKQPEVLKHLFKNKYQHHAVLQPPLIHGNSWFDFQNTDLKAHTFLQLRSLRPQKLSWTNVPVANITNQMTIYNKGEKKPTKQTISSLQEAWGCGILSWMGSQHPWVSTHPWETAHTILHCFTNTSTAFMLECCFRMGKSLDTVSPRRNWRFPPPWRKLQC